ncbi:MBL fold metallo-hydrolase [Clostridium sp. D2Q-14]|uniref:MBL fold metallo-hydrolase n=1 Tax=Anaeromonas gelatinilytica TaxID=2683194 RepID=UPI00193BEBB5|nr:MBL fold metallo-hydrolase [Anaeromonas gelatinilytica]MBS4534651.1 MBL fold metallo-hydrolase [Anaeromonas gelatinilytica]
MKLTILGNNGPYPKAGEACSGYLLEHKDIKILIDCGNGVLSRLQKFYSVNELDAIILTHLHSDHISDIFIMKYALGLGKNNKTIPIYTAYDDQYLLDNMNYNNAFEINFIVEDKEVIIGDIHFSFIKNKHPVDTYGVKAVVNNKKFVYSSDTSYFDEIINFIKEADLFLCESGVLSKDKNNNIMHLTPKDASILAKEAKVKKLLLTHFYPEYKRQSILKELSDDYNFEIKLSEEMKSYIID